MPFPAPSWGNYLIFPPIVKRASFGRQHKTDHVENDATDIFNSRWSEGRWRFSLSGAQIHAKNIDTWDAFVDALEGMAKPCLFWLKSSRFACDRAIIGTGDGARRKFQIVKPRPYPYGPASAAAAPEKIRFPWHNYPPLLHPNGVAALETGYVRVWVNGVEMVWLAGWDIEREGGVLTFDAAPAPGAVIQVSCRYLLLVHGQDYMPADAEGSANVYEFGEGAALFQAKGEENELFAALDAVVEADA